jgi:hypothetical protein
MSQKLLDRFSIPSMDSPFSLPRVNERLGPVLIKLSDGDTSASPPLCEIDKQSWFGLHRERCITLVPQRCCK